MATSGNFSTSNQYIKYNIEIETLSQNIANNTSNIKVTVKAWRTNQGYTTYGAGTCYANINGVDYSQAITSSQTITYNSDTVLLEKTATITHDADGKKNIYVSAHISHERFNSSSQGFNVELAAIPRQATILTAPNFKDTDNPAITYSNPAGAAVTSLQACISLDNSTALISYRDLFKAGSSYTFNLTQSERNALLAATPNSNTLSVYFIVKSVIGGVTYYSSLNRTMTVVNANPTIGGLTYQDVNPTTIYVTQDNQKIIQRYSRLNVIAANLAALKSATLASIEISIDSISESDTLSGSTVASKTIDMGYPDISSPTKAIAKVTDSRGNFTTKEVNITFLEYYQPSAIISLTRKSNYYDESYLKVNADYSSIDGRNTIYIEYRYREKGGSYNSYTRIYDDITYTLTLDNTKTYEFNIRLEDGLGNVTSYDKVLQIGIPILFIDRLRRSVGIGTIPPENNMLAVDRRLQLRNLQHELVMDLWSTTQGGGNIRAAMFRILNQDSKELIYMNADGTNGNGFIRINDATGKVLTYSGRSSNGGGLLSVCDNNNSYRGQLYYDGSGGRVWLGNNNGDTIAEMLKGTNGGVMRLKNDSGNYTVTIFTDNNAAGRINTFDDSGNMVTTLRHDTGGGQIIACDDSAQELAWLYVNNGGRLWLADSSGNAVITANAYNGVLTCVSVVQTSSIKVKENVKPLDLDEALKILQLIAVTFDFKDPDRGKDKRGFIAEDVAEVIPQLVTPETEKEPAKLDYIGIIPYLQTVIKDQEHRIKELEQRLSDLEKKINEK